MSVLVGLREGQLMEMERRAMLIVGARSNTAADVTGYCRKGNHEATAYGAEEEIWEKM